MTDVRGAGLPSSRAGCRWSGESCPRPSPDQALVRPRRVGVCGTDYHIFEGQHPFLEYPRVMGHELAVEVVEAQDGSALRPGGICVVNPYLSCGRCNACLAGKPNCCVRISVLGVHQDGGMTQFLCLPAANLIAADGLSVDKCATVEFLAIGAHAVRRAALTGSRSHPRRGSRADRPRRGVVRPSRRRERCDIRSRSRAGRSGEVDRRRRHPSAIIRTSGRRCAASDERERIRCRLRRHGQSACHAERLRPRRPWRSLRPRRRDQRDDHICRPRFPSQGDDSPRKPQRHGPGLPPGDDRTPSTAPCPQSA